MPRYTVHAPSKGVPPLGAVLTPHMTRTYAGWSSRGKVHGQPGTQGIPIPDPAAIPHGIQNLAAGGTSNTQSCPDIIYPPLYWEADAPQDKEKFPASVFSDNQMPIPAVRAPNVYVFRPYISRKGGQRQVTQPQVVQMWRGMKGTPSA